MNLNGLSETKKKFYFVISNTNSSLDSFIKTRLFDIFSMAKQRAKVRRNFKIQIFDLNLTRQPLFIKKRWSFFVLKTAAFSRTHYTINVIQRLSSYPLKCSAFLFKKMPKIFLFHLPENCVVDFS